MSGAYDKVKSQEFYELTKKEAPNVKAVLELLGDRSYGECERNNCEKKN